MHFSSLPPIIIFGKFENLESSHGSSVAIVTRLWAGGPRKRGCTPGKRKKYTSSLNSAHWQWDPPAQRFDGYRGLDGCEAAAR